MVTTALSETVAPFAVIPARITYDPAATPAGVATLTSQSSIAPAPSVAGASELTVVQPAGSVIACVIAIESLDELRTMNGAVTTVPGATDISGRELRTVTGDAGA